MRRCFPHIGGQTKTPCEPGFTRRCLQLSTSLTIEPLSLPSIHGQQGKGYFLAPPLPCPLHAIGNSVLGATGRARLNCERAESEETGDGDERGRASPPQQEIGGNGHKDDPCRQHAGIQPVVRQSNERRFSCAIRGSRTTVHRVMRRGVGDMTLPMSVATSASHARADPTCIRPDRRHWVALAAPVPRVRAKNLSAPIFLRNQNWPAIAQLASWQPRSR